MNNTLKTLLIAFIIAISGVIGSAVLYAGVKWGDTHWVTIASTERALLRQYRLEFLDLEYLETKGWINERELLKKEQLQIDIEELKEELK